MANTTADKLDYLAATKEAIRLAIVEKGVSVPVNTPFRQYADKIKQIKAGGTASVEVDTRPAFNTSVEYVESGVKKTVVSTDAYLEFDGG